GGPGLFVPGSRLSIGQVDECSLEAGSHVDRGGIAQRLPCPRDISLRSVQVTGLSLLIDGLHGLTRDLPDVVEQLVQRRRFAAGDVEGLTGDPFGRRGEHGAVDRVVDVGEVPRLLAVAEDYGRLVAERRGDESRDDGRVLRERILPRTENVEVAD